MGIAYDWVSDRLYWTDETYGRILSARNNGSEKVIIAASSRPRAIAVHPCKGSVVMVGEAKRNTFSSQHADCCSGPMSERIHPFAAQH